MGEKRKKERVNIEMELKEKKGGKQKKQYWRQWLRARVRRGDNRGRKSKRKWGTQR